MDTNIYSTFATEIVVRLNGFRDERYSSKVSYEVFKSLGRIYERKYQKDVNDSFDVLNPVFSVLDSVFRELSKNVGMMNKSVRNSFLHAYGESKNLEFLENLEGHELEKAVSYLGKNTDVNQSQIDALLTNTEKIKQNNWIRINDQSMNDLLILATAKRKLERQLDWLYCSFDKETFNELTKMEKLNEVETFSTLIDSNKVCLFNSTIRSLLQKKYTKFINDEHWTSSQQLSIILKSNSTEKDTLYIDSKQIPDANDLGKIQQIIQYIQKENRITPKKLSLIMKITPRMASYYLEAAEMLRIVHRKGQYYYCTENAKKFERYSTEDKSGIIEQAIRELPVVQAFLLYMKNNSRVKFTHKDVIKFLEKITDLSHTTCFRRGSTLVTWLCDGGIALRHNGNYSLAHNTGQTNLLEFTKLRK